MTKSSGKSSTGLDNNVAGLLCYAGGVISGIVFILIERESKFVRFHAMQSTIVFGIAWLVNVILGVIPVIGWIFAMIIGIVWVILWIFLMVRAYRGETYKLQWAGDLAENWANQFN